MAKRTIIRFESNNAIWPIVEGWAKERDYREKTRGDNWRQYRQGYGFLVAPKVVEIHQEGTKVEIQGWINPHWTNRILVLFLMPGEIDLGRGFMASIPRNTARRDVNILLDKFGQSSLKIQG